MADSITCAAKGGISSLTSLPERKKNQPPASASNSRTPPMAIHLRGRPPCFAEKGAVCLSKELPQVVQNFTPGALLAPQAEHTRGEGGGAKGIPQFIQNEIPSGFGV